METGTPWLAVETARSTLAICPWSPQSKGSKRPSIQASLTAKGILVHTEAAGHWTVRGYDVTGRLLGASDALHHSAGEQNWTFDDMGDWVSRSTFLEMHFEVSGYGAETWTTTLKRAPLR